MPSWWPLAKKAPPLHVIGVDNGRLSCRCDIFVMIPRVPHRAGLQLAACQIGTQCPLEPPLCDSFCNFGAIGRIGRIAHGMLTVMISGVWQSTSFMCSAALVARQRADWPLKAPCRCGTERLPRNESSCGSSVVEHSIGNGEVDSSILSRSTSFPQHADQPTTIANHRRPALARASTLVSIS